MLASGIWFLHAAVTLFLAVAWLLPWTATLWLAVLAYPLVQLNWLAFGNRCFLTVLEERLRGGKPRELPAPEADGDPPHDFVSAFLSHALGRRVPRRLSNALSYGVVWGGFAIAALRLWGRSASS